MLLTISYKPMKSDSKMSIPELFRCPISLDLFTDPVTLCTGHTYDRPYIEKWISSGNLTCPITMLSLHDRSMVPNITLSHLISQWLDGQTGESPSSTPASDGQRSLVVLKEILESQELNWEKKINALKQVHFLCNDQVRENDGLIKLGFLELLIELVFEKKRGFSHQRLELVELALAIIMKMIPFGNRRCLNLIKQEPKIESLLALLDQGTSLIKITLCQLLDAKELSSMMQNSGEIQQSILNLIDLNHNTNEEVSEAAVKLIHTMCLSCVDHHHHHHHHHHRQPTLEKLVQLGYVGALVRYILRSLKREKGHGVGAAMEVIEFMLEMEGGKEALLGEKNGVKALVKMVFRVCDHEGSENAVKSLIGLCCESIEAREEAVKVGVLTQLLLLLQSQCSLKAKAKARMLLKLLRVMWAKDPLVVC